MEIEAVPEISKALELAKIGWHHDPTGQTMILPQRDPSRISVFSVSSVVSPGRGNPAMRAEAGTHDPTGQTMILPQRDPSSSISVFSVSSVVSPGSGNPAMRAEAGTMTRPAKR